MTASTPAATVIAGPSLDLTRVLTLPSPRCIGTALAMICRVLPTGQRAAAARTLTAGQPDGTYDYWLRTVAALLVQGGPSATEGGGTCLYRGFGDRACAVGMWIPDEAYAEVLEGCSVDTLATRGPLRWLRPSDADTALQRAAERSQTVHDVAAANERRFTFLSWPERLAATAREHSAPEGVITMIDAFVVESSAA